jgi:hypothetical protein
MTEQQLKRLRTFYRTVLGIKEVFVEAAARHVNVEETPVNWLASEMSRLEAEFPGLVPQFDPKQFFSHHADYDFYKVAGIRSYLASVISILSTEVDSAEATPVIEAREFAFVSEPGLRSILERDYPEIQRAFVAKCWKSVLILSGGAIEAILADLLLKNRAAASASPKAPKKPDITRWDLSELIDVSVDLGLVTGGIEKLSHSVREYRNLVHPGNELRSKLKFDAEEARIALEVLHIVHRDLSS